MQKSENFYDTVYKRFQRNKFTKFIYPIAFRPPSQQSSDPLRTERSEVPYLPYAGKVIRNITVRTLAPFGTSLADTGWTASTGAIKAMNSAHITTLNYIVRKELRFKKGERIDPNEMAENERNIRELSFIDNVRFIIREISPGNDTVDIQVLSKDVWSIGIGVNTVTSSKISMVLYDANFLGLGDRVSIRMSMATERAPFYRIDGFNYTYHNISGSFINGIASFSQDDRGNQNVSLAFARRFFANTTRWAGALSFSQSRSVDDSEDTSTIYSSYQEELAWMGVAFPLRGAGWPARFIIAESVYNKYFLDRPSVTATTDRFYNNTTHILTGLSLSWNRYYTTSYIREFGKPENLPYGRLTELTIGPALTEFSTRMYTGLSLTAGNLIGKFGYLSGGIDLAGFIDRNNFEDGVIKVSLNYLSNLYTSADRRYKFRGIVSAAYGLGFNRTEANRDYYDLNSLFRLVGLDTDTALEGTQCFGLKVGGTAFTPWRWYGFRFAVTAFAQFGITSVNTSMLKMGTYIGGFSAGLVIKNDNLVFPPFFILITVFPGNQTNVPPIRLDMTTIPRIPIYDFVPGAPAVQTLNN